MGPRPNASLQPRTLAVALGIALFAAACGADGESPFASDNVSEAEKSRIAESYRDCMSEGGLEAEVDYSNGLDISVSGDASISEEEMLAIEAGCEPILTSLDAGGPELDPEDEARLADVLLDVQKCLAADGYVVSLTDDGIDLNGDDQSAGFDEAAYAQREDECFQEAAPDLYEKYVGE